MKPAAARQAMRGAFVIGVLGAFGLAAGCSIGGGGNELAGSVSAVAVESDQPGRWLITVDLDSGSIAGSSDVQVAFDSIDLVCDDGSGVVVPSSLSVGDRLTIVRDEDGEVETSDPPIVSSERVIVLCSQ